MRIVVDDHFIHSKKKKQHGAITSRYILPANVLRRSLVAFYVLPSGVRTTPVVYGDFIALFTSVVLFLPTLTLSGVLHTRYETVKVFYRSLQRTTH